MKSAFKRDHPFHAHMLADRVRLSAFQRAFASQLKPGQSAVEIGSGTGVLSLMALKTAKIKVQALEYFSDLSALSKANARSAAIDFQCKSSYAFTSASPLDGMFSEMIGAWGPEENIVEIFYDFCLRHPNLKWLIPNSLHLLAQEAILPQVANDLDHFEKACETAREFSDSDFSIVAQELTRAYSESIQCAEFHPRQVTLLSEPIVLKAYQLGVDRSSQFEREIFLKNEQGNSLHLWFEASLGPGNTLSSNVLSPLTHWRHLYLPRPQKAKSLSIRYIPQERGFECHWKK